MDQRLEPGWEGSCELRSLQRYASSQSVYVNKLVDINRDRLTQSGYLLDLQPVLGHPGIFESAALKALIASLLNLTADGHGKHPEVMTLTCSCFTTGAGGQMLL